MMPVKPATPTGMNIQPVSVRKNVPKSLNSPDVGCHLSAVGMSTMGASEFVRLSSQAFRLHLIHTSQIFKDDLAIFFVDPIKENGQEAVFYPSHPQIRPIQRSRF